MKLYFYFSVAFGLITISSIAAADCIPYSTTREWLTPEKMQAQSAACSSKSEEDCKADKSHFTVGSSFFCGWRESGPKQNQALAAIAKAPVEQTGNAACKHFDQKKFDFLTKEAKSSNGALCSEANSKQQFGPAEKNLYIAMAKVEACEDFHVSGMEVTETQLYRGFSMQSNCDAINLSDANASIGGGTVSVSFNNNDKSQNVSFNSNYNLVGPARSVDFWYQQFTEQLLVAQIVADVKKLNSGRYNEGATQPNYAVAAGLYSKKSSLSPSGQSYQSDEEGQRSRNAH